MGSRLVGGSAVITWFLIFFAAIGLFCITWKLGEWLSHRKAAKFAERRESWRSLEIKPANERDPAEG